jgi:hypothetical protein
MIEPILTVGLRGNCLEVAVLYSTYGKSTREIFSP